MTGGFNTLSSLKQNAFGCCQRAVFRASSLWLEISRSFIPQLIQICCYSLLVILLQLVADFANYARQLLKPIVAV